MDPYVYPGTNVLKNLRDLRDPGSLATYEAIATIRRIEQLTRQRVTGKFDVKHLQAIHRHIFQDVFDWAGNFRTVNISRSGQIPFALVPQILPLPPNPSQWTLQRALPRRLAARLILPPRVSDEPNASGSANWPTTTAEFSTRRRVRPRKNARSIPERVSPVGRSLSEIPVDV
jgi:hypothetical protein